MKKIEKIPINENILETLYIDYGYSMRHIARIFHTSHKKISGYIEKYEIQKRKRYFCYHKINIDEKLLQNLYLNQKKSIIKIGKELKIYPAVISKRLKDFDIPLRVLSESCRGQHNSPSTEFKKGEKHKWKNTEKEEDVKRKISESKIGNKNPNWHGGVSFEPYCIFFNDEFRERVREYFNRCCYVCGKNETENNQRLSVHHVTYNKETCCDDSKPLFVPLCQTCHAKTNFDREYWQEFFTISLNYLTNGECYLKKGWE